MDLDNGFLARCLQNENLKSMGFHKGIIPKRYLPKVSTEVRVAHLNHNFGPRGLAAVRSDGELDAALKFRRACHFLRILGQMVDSLVFCLRSRGDGS